VTRYISILCLIMSFHLAASDIKIAAGNFAPYFRVDTQVHKQGLYEILITSAFSKLLLNPKYINVSNEAIKRYYQKNRVDLAIN